MHATRPTILMMLAALTAGVSGAAGSMTFETVPPDTTFGNDELPGDVLLVENGITAYAHPFHVGPFEFFHIAGIGSSAWTGLGQGHVLQIHNIAVEFDFARYGCVERVELEYADYGGIENVRVNGVAFEGDLLDAPAAIAPGVTLIVSPHQGQSGSHGVITLIGDVNTLVLGGQELLVDSVVVATTCGLDVDCDGNIDVADLAALIGAWGAGDCAEDLDHNGAIDIKDLDEFLNGFSNAWGSC